MKPYYEGRGAVIYQGDCLEMARDIQRVEAVLTDPPYSSGARRDADRQVRGAVLRSMKDADWFSHDAMSTWGFTWFLRSVFVAVRSRVKLGGHLYVFTDWRQTPNVYAIMESCGYRVNHCLVWDKSYFGMGSYWRNQYENIVFCSNGKPLGMLDRGRGSVLEFPPVSSARRIHPTEKPVPLLRSLISAFPAQDILDPFLGSGSTAVAAVLEGRKVVGVEIDERWCEVAAKRIEALPIGLGERFPRTRRAVSGKQV